MSDSAIACPECGALVDLLRGRWILVHREGSSGYEFPAQGRRRCPGSLLQVVPLPGEPRRSDGATGHVEVRPDGPHLRAM